MHNILGQSLNKNNGSRLVVINESMQSSAPKDAQLTCSIYNGTTWSIMPNVYCFPRIALAKSVILDGQVIIFQTIGRYYHTRLTMVWKVHMSWGYLMKKWSIFWMVNLMKQSWCSIKIL